MELANRFSIVRRADHFVLRFGFAEDETEGVEVARLAVPITVGIKIATDLFEAMLRSTYDLNREMAAVQVTMSNLNNLSQELQAKAAADATANSGVEVGKS